MEKETTKDEIKKMEVGETASFPIERFAVIQPDHIIIKTLTLKINELGFL